MEELGIKYDTDKITHHGYHRFYESFLQQFCTLEMNMLEIGIETKASLKMWLEYFPKGNIYGIDINFSDNGDRYKIFKGDQSDTNFLKTLNLPSLDFIIDDGSHVPQHQIITFNALFPKLKDGGVYIVEDIETSYWKDGPIYNRYRIKCGYMHSESVIEIFKNAADYINDEFIKDELKILRNYNNKFISQENLQKIGSITFCQNCIIIKKKDSSFSLYDNRKYRFGDNL